MRFVLVIAVFVVLGLFMAERSLPAHAECAGQTDSCLVLPMNNPLHIKLLFPLFSNHKGHITITMFCEVRNPSDTLQPIHLDQFTIASTGGAHFKPFYGKKNGTDGVPIEWVPAGAHEDHVIQFISEEPYTRKAGDKFIKANRFYVEQQHNGKTDSLFAIAYGHVKRD